MTVNPSIGREVGDIEFFGMPSKNFFTETISYSLKILDRNKTEEEIKYTGQVPFIDKN